MSSTVLSGSPPRVNFSGKARPARDQSLLRPIPALLVLLVFVLGAVLVSLFIGGRTIGAPMVWEALSGRGPLSNQTVIWSLRVPRTAIAISVGLALGLAGALAQGHTRNPLADPGLMGVSSGAALAVLLGQIFLSAGPLASTFIALTGALIAALAVLYATDHISAKLGSHLGLVLIGAAVSTCLTAITTALILLDPRSLDSYRYWSIGSVAGRNLEVLLAVAPALLCGLLLSAANASGLNQLALGESTAVSLGQNLRRTYFIGIVAISLLTGAAVAVAGPVAFLGLTATHVARPLIGSDFRWLLPAAGLAGAALLTFSDVLGRVIIRPAELQVGIVLAFLGSPLLMILVRHHRKDF